MPDRELVSGNRQAEDLQFEVGLRPRRLADFTGQTQAEREPVDRHRGRAQTRRGDGSRPAVRAAGPWQDYARIDHRRGTGRAVHHDLGPGAAEEARSDRNSEQYSVAPGILHRRNSPSAAGRGRDALLSAGGFPRGHPGGRGTRSADAFAAHAEVHGDRRHYAARPGERAAAWPLRSGAAAGSVLDGRIAFTS